MAYIQILPITRGGTGSATASGARTNLGVPATTAVMLLSGAQAMTGNMDLGSNRIVSLADPSGAQDAATKAYVDAVASGLDLKASVRAATTANITLSGAQTIDGVSVVATNRVLVKDQTDPTENGIYTAAAGAWSRSTDADSNLEVTPGMYTFVEEGTVNADSGWVLTTDGAITLGSTSLAFTQFSGAGAIVAGAGLTKTGNTLDVVGTTNRISVAADSIDISTNYVGQASITTLGTIATGVWNGTDIAVADGGTGSSTASGARSNLSAAPNTSQYVVIALDGELSAERVLTGTANRITIADGGANGNVTLDIGTDVVTLTGTQTLTNKTITEPVTTWGQSTKTANYTLVLTDDVILFNISSAATATLPTAASASGKKFFIVNRPDSTADATIDPDSAELIVGAATYVLAPGDSAIAFSDGTRWVIF